MECDVLVTGGAGFIGSHVVARLVDAGRSVRVLELPGVSVDHLRGPGVTIMRGDISSPADVTRAVTGCANVVHMAANPNLWHRDSHEFDRVNYRGAVCVIEAAVAAGARRIVHVSTESILAQNDRQQVITEQTRTCLGEMCGPYCSSKWRAEEAARRAAAHGLPVIIASPTVPVGPGDLNATPLTRLIMDYAAGRVSGTLQGDIAMIDVRDVAKGLLSVLDRGRTGYRYLLAGENWTTMQLFDALSQMTGIPAPRFAVPYPLALGFAHAEQFYCRVFNNRIPMATVTGVQLTRRGMKFDATQTNRELDFRAQPVIEALREAVAWLGRRGHIVVP